MIKAVVQFFIVTSDSIWSTRSVR